LLALRRLQKLLLAAGAVFTGLARHYAVVLPAKLSRHLARVGHQVAFVDQLNFVVTQVAPWVRTFLRFFPQLGSCGLELGLFKLNRRVCCSQVDKPCHFEYAFVYLGVADGDRRFVLQCGVELAPKVLRISLVALDYARAEALGLADLDLALGV
jgi:hypothetical protein